MKGEKQSEKESKQPRFGKDCPYYVNPSTCPFGNRKDKCQKDTCADHTKITYADEYDLAL